jgi:hypothetical protein
VDGGACDESAAQTMALHRVNDCMLAGELFSAKVRRFVESQMAAFCCVLFFIIPFI